MAQITYTNKVALNENPEIAAINKVSDDDMNEIKQVVNANYNNTIQITDTQPSDNDWKIWIDTGEVSAAASEITNTYNTSQHLGYSCNYLNSSLAYEGGELQITNTTQVDGYVYYHKIGRIVQITGSVTIKVADSSAWANIVILAVPNNLVPYELVMETTARDIDGKLIGVGVSTAGNLYLAARGRSSLTPASNNSIPFSLTYIVAE